MKKLILSASFLFVLLFSANVNAQSYKSAVGLRLGSPVSVSYKQFLNETNAFEVYGGFRNYSTYNSYNVSAAYLIHTDLSNVTENLTWYYGGGASAFFFNFDSSFISGNTTFFGVQAYLGLDYKFDTLPVNASVDWVPTYLLGEGAQGGFGSGYGALSVRYVF